jgi:hypothetical protein
VTRAGAAVVVLAAFAATALPARGALVVGLSTRPARPHVGEMVGLSLRTFAPVSDPTQPCGFRRTPLRVHYPFRVDAEAPDANHYAIRVVQREDNLYVGRLRVCVAGRWTIRVTNYAPSYEPCSGGVLRFLVAAQT